MSRWVRLWEDMPTDPKWRVVRHRASQSVTGISVCTIVGMFAFMLAKADKNGNLINWCDEDVAAALELGTDQVSAIFAAMQGKVLDGNHLKGWNNRQPVREDSSTVRMRASRAKSDALKRNVTHGDAPEERRIETETNSLRSLVVARARDPTTTQKSKIHGKAKITAGQIEAANEKGLSEKERLAEWEKFKNYNQANGTEFANWNAAWRMWLEKIKPSPKPNGHDQQSTHQIFVQEDTPAWNAWETVYRTSKGIAPPKIDHPETRKSGWYFPTEYPPTE